MKIILNPNKELVDEINEGLKRTGGYCPCMIEHNEDTRCMCKQFREMAEGECHCGKFIKIKED